MAIKDTNSNNITGFKWTMPEVENITDAFMKLVECNAMGSCYVPPDYSELFRKYSIFR